MICLHRALLAVMLCLLAGCGGSATSDQHLANGKALMADGKYHDAVVEFKAALNKDVHQVEARALLGKVYYESGDLESAEKELSRALEADQSVDRSLVVPIFAQTLLLLGDYGRLDDLEVDGLDARSRSTTLAAKGLAILYQGDEVVAQELLKTAVDTGEASLYARVAEARLYLAQGDYDQARSKLEAIIDENGKYAPAWNLMGDIYAASRQPQAAEAAYTFVLKLNHKAFDALLNRAMMRIYQQDFKGARSDLKELKQRHGRAAIMHPGVSFAEGITHLQAGFHEHARKEFEKAAEFSYAYPLSYYYMAVIDLHDGRLERALTEIYRFLALAPESIAGPKLAAKLEFELGGFHAAETLLQPVLEIAPNDVEALNLLASALLAQGRGGEGVEVLAKIVELKPDSPWGRVRLGAGYIAAGEVDSGIAALQDIVSTNPKFEPADMLIVLNFLRNGQHEQALEAALEYRDRNPGSSGAYNLVGRAQLANGNEKKAEEAFLKALEINPADPAARHGLADVAISRGRYDAARKQYRTVLKYEPERLNTQLDYAASYALEGRETEMLHRLELANDAHPEATEPRLVLARYHIAKGQLEEAQAVFERLSPVQRDQPDVLATLASFELAGNRFNQALVTLKRLMQIRPGVSQYHYMLAKAHAGLGDKALALQELQRVVKLDPGHFYARIAQARLALLMGNGELFKQRLANLKEVAPENPDVIRLEATAAQLKGDARYAGYLLGIVFHQSPTTANLIAMVEHARAIGDTGMAVKQLEKWLREHPLDVKARENLAEIARERGDMERAIREYKTIVEQEGSNVIALNNLAWYLLDYDPVQALTHAERAYALAPESVAVLDTLAMAQFRNGKLPEARRTLSRALELAPEDPSLRFHEVRIMVAQGEREGAVETLASVLSKNDEFAERDKAEAFLRRLR